MTSTLKGQLETMNTNSAFQILRKPIWLGILALLGAFLLVGGSLTWAATPASNAAGDEKLLSPILEQLADQGKKVKSSSVTTTNGESEVIITMMDGGIRKYDSQGRLSFEKDAHGKTTKYEKGMPVEERDSHGTILATYHYDRSRTGEVQRSVKTSKAGVEIKLFDNRGNIIQLTNSNGTKIYSNYVKNSKNKTVSYTETDLNTNKSSQMILNPKTGEIVGRISDNGVKTDVTNIKDNNGQISQTIEKDSAGNETVKNFVDGQITEEIKNGIKTVYENFLSDKGGLGKVIEKKMTPWQGGMNIEQTVKEYDEGGRVVRQIDNQGDHQYKYELNRDGRMVGKREWKTDKDGKHQKEVYTKYDEAGRVVASEESGKTTNTTYILDDKGNMKGSIETTSFTMGGKSFTETIRKEFDKNGRETSETDENGVKSEYTYDENGNRIRSKSPYQDSHYTFDRFSNMISSVDTDNKSSTFTLYDTKTKLAKSKVKIKNSGAMEITVFGINQEGKRVSYTSDAFGIKVSVNRNSTSDQPEKVINYKNNGKIITTTYEYAGEHMSSSKEVGPSGETDTTYNIWGKPVHVDHTDQFGRVSTTDYNYRAGRMANSTLLDEKGKTVTEFNDFEDPSKIFRHNDIGFPRDSMEERVYSNGMLTQSISHDFRGTKYTFYDAEETPTQVHTVNRHGWPRENWVTNVYDKGGDVVKTIQIDMRGYTVNNMDTDGLTQKTVRIDFFGFPKKKTTTYGYEKGEMVTSTESDDRGRSENKFDKDGLMTHSVRTKLFQFPRVETTDYKYDGNGFMSFSQEVDENGTTDSFYNIDEVTDTSHRVNTFGHARDQWTKFQYDDEGFMTFSKESDLKGATITQYNIDSLAMTQIRTDHYGLKYGQVTLTSNQYDDQGFMTTAFSKNLLGTTNKTFDKDALTRLVVQDDNFGLESSKHKVSDNYEYDDHGRMLKSLEHDGLGWSVSKYDINGDATWSERFANTGVNLARDTTSETTYQKDTGMTTYRISKNAMSTSESFDFDPVSGLESRQETTSVYGLLSSIHTSTRMVMDDRHGLSRESFAKNDASLVHTIYDTVAGGRHGVAQSSDTVNTWGLYYAKYVHTDIWANINNGMNHETVTTSRGHGSSTDPYVGNGPIFSRTKTIYDDVTYGCALRSDGVNSFGLHYNQYNHTDIKTNPNNGLQVETTVVSRGKGSSADPFVGSGPVASVTKTKYKDQTTGVAYQSQTMSSFGLRGSLYNSTWIDCNETTGLNRVTESTTQGKGGQDFTGNGQLFSKTRTEYKDTTTGVADHSLSKNAKGLLGSNFNETWIDCNENTGLNHETVSETSGMTGALGDGTYLGNSKLFSMSKTNFKDTTTGVADHSWGKNSKGILGSNFNETWIDCNENTGLNKRTLSESTHMTGNLSDRSDFAHSSDIFTMTRTDFDDELTGVAQHSIGKNSKGLLGSNFNETWIDCNTTTGLNQSTLSIASHMTGGISDPADFNHGGDVFNMSKTIFDDQNTGVALHSWAKNSKGTLGSNFTETWINCNTVTGLNKETLSEASHMSGSLTDPKDFNHGSDIFSMTKTDFDDQTYGVAQHSWGKNAKGVLGSNSTETWINCNITTGLNTSTLAVTSHMTGSLTDQKDFGHTSDVFSMTKTDFDDQTYGVAQHSVGKNAKGVLGSNFSETWIDCNTTTGLNISTLAVSSHMTGSLTDHNDFGHTADVFSMTKTDFDDKTYGVALHSVGKNAKGVLGSNFNETWINANITTGLNTTTLAVSSHMTGSLSAHDDFNHTSDVFSMTKTDYDDQTYGVALHSVGKNAKGVLGSNFNETWINANITTGLNTSTLSVSSHMTGSLTSHDDFAHSSDVFSMTKTDFDDKTYGVSLHSVGKNAKGVLGSNFNETWINANITTGLNTSTLSVSSHMTGSLTSHDDFSHTSDVFSMTKTDFDDQTYGVAQHSVGKNAKGVLGSNFNETWIDCNITTGLNKSTLSISSHMTGSLSAHDDFGHSADVFSMTKTDFDDQTYGVAQHSVGKNAKGVLGSNFNETWINCNITTGLNTSTLSVSSHMTGSLSAHDDFAHSSDVFSMTKTDFDDQTYGVALHSVGKNAKGVLGSNFSETWINCNVTTGLNTSTLSVSSHMTGSLTSPDDFNHTSDVFSMTKTLFDDQDTGVAQHSYGKNAKGILGSNFNETWINCNTTTGLNTSTLSVSSHMTGSLTAHDDFGHTSDVFSMTKTEFDDQTYGVALHSMGKNAKGVLGSNFSETWIDCNTTTGLNTSTLSISSHMTGSLSAHDDFAHTSDVFSMTKTDFDDQTYGVALHSMGKNSKGVLGSNFSETWINCNITTGLNTSTLSVSSHMTGSLTAHDDFSHSSDVFSMTKTTFDDQTTGVAQHSYGKNAMGLLGSNFTETWINCNTTTGLNTSTLSESSSMSGSLTNHDDFTHSASIFSMTKTLYEDQTTGVAQHSFGKNAKGLTGSNFSETWIDCNTTTGLNTSTISVTSHMTGSLTDKTDFGHDTEMFGMTKTVYDDQSTGVAQHSWGKNSKGLLGSNFNETWVDCNTTTGLNTSTLSISSAMTGSLTDFGDFNHDSAVFGMTKTNFDDASTGVALHSYGKNAKGLLGSNFNETWIDSNTTTGLNKSTISESSHFTGSLSDPNDFNHSSDIFSMTKTLYDDQTTGVAQHSFGKSAKGLLGSNFTETWINSNTLTGLNTSTISVATHMTGSLTDFSDFTHDTTPFSMTKTLFDDQHTGVAQHSYGKNAKGVLGSNFSETWIECNTTTGLNKSTISTTSHMTGSISNFSDFTHDSAIFGMTKTLFDDQNTGVAQHSYGKNSKGILGSNFCETWINVNTTTGLNTSTISVSSHMTSGLTDFDGFDHDTVPFNKTKTDFDDQTTGVARHSVGKAAKGVLGSNFSETWIDTNTTTGLNRTTWSLSGGMAGSETVADGNFTSDGNISGNTKTEFDDQNTGVGQHSLSKSGRGVYGSRFSETWIDCNTTTGLNKSTVVAAQGMTAGETVGDSTFTGDSKVMSRTKTVYDDTTTGVATHSYGTTYQGLNYARFTDTTITCNTTTGLNTSTTAIARGKGTASDPFEGNGPVFSTTTTDFDDQVTGVATNSTTTNTYGLGACLSSSVAKAEMVVNKYTGQNICTISRSEYGWTETWFKDTTTGVAKASDTNNCKGLIFARHSWVHEEDMAVDETTGLNQWTHSETLMSSSDTWYDSTYGTVNHTKTHNVYGLTKSADSETTSDNIIVNHDTGLTTWSKSVSDFGYTESWFKNDTYGNIDKTHTHNNYGAAKLLDTTTTFESNTYTNQHWGMNTFSTADGYLTTTSTWYESDYGTSTKSYAKNKNDKNGNSLSGANGARETWSDIVCNTSTGMNTSTVATNALGVTTTDVFDALYGTALHSTSDNTSGTTGSKHSETWIDASEETGLNRQTYSETKLSKTWTNFNTTTGGTTDSFSQMNDCANTLGWSKETTNYFFPNTDTNLNQYSVATNLAGWTETWYDSRGLGVANVNYSAVGVGFRTKTLTTCDNYWGITSSSTAYSYSRHGGKDSTELLSTTTSYMNVGTSGNGSNDGTVYHTDSTNQTGATNSSINHTNTTDYNAENGNKKKTFSWNLMGWSNTDYNDYGVESHTKNISYSGPTKGRVSDSYNTLWDGDTGIKRHGYSETGMSKTWSYFDENGMPSNDGVHTISYDSIAASVVGVSSIDVNAYTIKENLYGPAEGDKVEATAVTGDIWWSGVPSETTSYTALTSNRVEQDVNGFAKFSHTEKIFAANGSQATDTWNDVDQASGMTTHSHTINGATKHGTAYSDSYYDSTLGVVTKTENFNPKSDDSGGFDQTEAISQVDHSTGMTTDCETNNVGGDQYHNHSWGYDGTTGLNTYAHTDQKTQVGKGDGTKSYDSTFTYNPWTGLRKTEVRSNWANKTTDGDNPDYDMHYYDAHGVDEEAKSDCYSYPTGQQQQFTDFTGLGQDAEGNPIGMITKYGTDHTDTVDAMTVVNNHGSNAYCPTHSHITYDTATHKYITAVDINYTLVNNAPTSAIETDDHGTENWIMNGTYDQSGLVSRSRTVTGGGTYNWTYHPEDDPAGASFHEYATTSYTTYMGMYDGTGSESYTSSGLMTQQVLTNTNAMNETINFSNDGSFVTKGVGTRQDGQTTIYHFTGADLSSSEDDKGTTTWNTSTMQRQSTTGKMGTFTYTYFGNAITQITDTNNTMVFDQYWNLHQWTDSKNVVHTYTGTKFNKTKGNYWTQATETFTDSNGGAWTGTVTYDNWGYYFAGETLKGTHVKVDGSAAQNSTAMNTSTAATFIQGLLKKYNTSKEQAWSWTAPDDTPGRSPSTLGALQSALLNAGDLSLYADVEITINADGSTTSKYKNIYFNEENFVKENRYRPVVTHTANHVYVQNTRPSESDTRNWLSGNNKFASDGFGNHTYVSGGPTQVKVGSHQVQTGTDAKTGKPIYTSVDDYSYQWTVTSEDWGKTADGWMWVDQNTTTENHYADQLTETTNTVVAGPISTKTASSNAVGDTTLTDTTSTATAPVSTTLGSTGPSGTSGTLPGDTTAADQGTIFARPSASANTSGETGPRAKGAAVSAASTAPAPGAPVAKGQVPAAVGQDALLAKFASIKSLQDILAFVQMVADALGMQGILSGLEHSGAADLMKALVNAYKAVFGPAYHGSIVGKLVGMATDNNVVVDELQVAVNGNAALPNEVKLAARIAKELENAKRVTKDEDGKVVEAVDQKGGKYQYSYDASGLTETHTETNGQVTVTHYDNGGQLLSETTGGVSKTFSYQTNATGNVSGVTVTERSENGVATLGYDNKGRLVSADRNGQKSTITYDDSNNSYVVQDFNTGGDFQEARTYKEGHLAQVKRSDGSTINNEYMTDGSGKVLAMTETITDKDGKKSIMKYNGEGRLVTSLGEDAKKVEKTEEEGKIAEQAFGFEAGKETFGDPRMDGMRLDQKVMLQGVAPQQGAH